MTINEGESYIESIITYGLVRFVNFTPSSRSIKDTIMEVEPAEDRDFLLLKYSEYL